MKYDYRNIRELFGLDSPAPLDDEQIDKIRNKFGSIPEALDDYYRLCGGCEDMNATQDFLLIPDNKYTYGYNTFDHYNYDGYCVFYVENQCVAKWAIKKSDLSKENPPVYATTDDGATWHKTTDTVSQFLTIQAYQQAAFSFEYSIEEFYEATDEQLQQIAERFRLVAKNSSPITESKFFQPYTDTIIFSVENMLIYSSRSEQHFNEIDAIMSEILGL